MQVKKVCLDAHNYTVRACQYTRASVLVVLGGWPSFDKGVKAMSYAGTYGADETCKHDVYWRSCSSCSLVGPRATEEQIQQRLREREQEIEHDRQEELRRQAAYEELDAAERIAAEALWELVLRRYPGFGQPTLNDAVRKRIDTGHIPTDAMIVGMARGACQQAKAVVAALRTHYADI